MNFQARLLIATLSVSALAVAQAPFTGPVTGQSSPNTTGVDQAVESILTKYQIPGAALAVSVNGKLVYARGYGYANVQSSTPVQPDSLFRIASISKTFTAMATLKLIEQGKLTIDQPVLPLLNDLAPAGGITADPRDAQITVRELLNHTAGWDRSIVPDAVEIPLITAAAVNQPAPASCDTTVRYLFTQPLQHAPGSVYAYSNAGYCVLTAVISRVSGTTYEQYVRQNVLTPLGIQRAKLGAPFATDVANGEVTYYDYPGAPLVTNVYNPQGALVAAPYGGHDFEAAEGTGAWVTTPIELLRFILGIDRKSGGTPLLQPSTIQLMQTESAAFTNPNSFYGLGFNMATDANGLNWFKDGSLPGTSSFVYRQPNGFGFAIVFNSRPSGGAEESSGDSFETDYVSTIRTALFAVKGWPQVNLFSTFQSTLVAPSISVNGVVQGATFAPGIVSGSWVTIQGTNLSTATRTWRGNEFKGDGSLPTSVESVQVTMNGKPAAVYYVSPTQLNVQAPSDTTLGPVAVVVTHDGQVSNSMQAQLVSQAPGFFAYQANAQTNAAGIHLDGSYVGNIAGTRPAAPGETVELYGTGFGPSTAGRIISTVSVLTPSPTVTIGGVPATVQFAGLVAVGEFQLNVVIPQVAAGSQPIVVTYNGATSPSNVQIAVGSN